MAVGFQVLARDGTTSVESVTVFVHGVDGAFVQELQAFDLTVTKVPLGGSLTIVWPDAVGTTHLSTIKDIRHQDAIRVVADAYPRSEFVGQLELTISPLPAAWYTLDLGGLEYRFPGGAVAAPILVDVDTSCLDISGQVTVMLVATDQWDQPLAHQRVTLALDADPLPISMDTWDMGFGSMQITIEDMPAEITRVGYHVEHRFAGMGYSQAGPVSRERVADLEHFGFQVPQWIGALSRGTTTLEWPGGWARVERHAAPATARVSIPGYFTATPHDVTVDENWVSWAVSGEPNDALSVIATLEWADPDGRYEWKIFHDPFWPGPLELPIPKIPGLRPTRPDVTVAYYTASWINDYRTFARDWALTGQEPNWPRLSRWIASEAE